jgi:hypothetical protein
MNLQALEKTYTTKLKHYHVELRYPLGRFLLCYYGGGTTQREFDVRFGALKSKTYKTTKIMV